jgi:hypothetical protein
MPAAVLRLWHVSEAADIDVFVPRAPPERSHGVNVPVVWAVNAERLPNYLVPRDFPRVTFHRNDETTHADSARFSLSHAKQVVVIEVERLLELASASVWLYELPTETFRCLDVNAGYFVSERAVTPISKRLVGDLPSELSFHGAELRTSDKLRSLADYVGSSSLGFSIIRLQNARPI